MKELYTYLLLIFILGSSDSYGQGQWIKKESFPGPARHRSTGFSIGNKGYVGGGHINSGTLITYDDYWEYDPASDAWTQIADYGGGQRYHSVAFTLDGAAYVGTGENGTFEYTSDFWKYVPLVNTWFPVADLPGNPRRASSSFIVDGIAYVGLGQSETGYETDFYRFDPAANSWTPVASFVGSPRSGAVSFAYGEFGYIATGHEVGAATNDFYSYHPSSDTWTQLTDVDTTLRQDATGFTLNDKGYVLTGNNEMGTDSYKDVWEYDFVDGTWTRISDFPGSARRYFVSFVIGNKEYCCGGTDGTNLKDLWQFDPTVGGISEKENLNLSVYPNPSNGVLRIMGVEEFQGISLELYQDDGRLIHSQDMISGVIQIPDDLSSGRYLLKIYSNGRYITTEPLILF